MIVIVIVTGEQRDAVKQVSEPAVNDNYIGVEARAAYLTDPCMTSEF